MKTHASYINIILLIIKKQLILYKFFVRVFSLLILQTSHKI